MILSRLRYRPVTVPLQFLGLRYRTLPFLDQRYPRLSCVTDRDTSVTQRYMRYRTLQALPNVTERYRALQNVTERYRTLQALQSVTYGIYGFWRI
jgi:hypothetical protein